MIDKDFLESLIRMVDESSLDNLEIERGGTRIRLSKSPDGTGVVTPPSGLEAPLQAPAVDSTSERDVAAVAPASNLTDVPSPMVGTFYRSPAPDAGPYVEVGSQVGVGDVLCIIEAMKLMNELECESAGRIAEVCVENGEPVEFGQVLFRIEPA